MRRPTLLAMLLLCAVPLAVAAQDAPTVESVNARIANVEFGLNFVWTLVAGFLVMLMQLGFCMVETGFTRAKNAAHTAAMNFMVYGVAMMAYWAVGFAIQAGGVGTLGGLGTFEGAKEAVLSLGGKDWGIIGTQGFFLTGVAYTAPVFGYFLFQMVFMDTTATIPTGALAERWKFTSFLVFTLFIGALIYPLYANWVWGGGWLSQLGSNAGLGHGHVDFAGSSVVHMTGGVIALVTAKLLGARRGKFNADGSPNAIPGHNIPMAIFGTFVLCFGWFGFNAGSTLMGTDLRIGVIATNTTIARDAVKHLAHGEEAGGLSGAPVLAASNRVIAQLRAALGKGFPIIGVGGVMSGADAAAKIAAGADLVQIYTGFIYGGPGLVTEAARAIASSRR